MVGAIFALERGELVRPVAQVPTLEIALPGLGLLHGDEAAADRAGYLVAADRQVSRTRTGVFSQDADFAAVDDNADAVVS